MHHTVVDVARRIDLVNRDTELLQYVTGVDLVADEEGCRPRLPLPFDYRPVDRRGAAVLRQQRAVQVEGAQPGHGPHGFRQHAEGHHDLEVGRQGPEFRQKFFAFQIFRLQHGNAQTAGGPLYG